MNELLLIIVAYLIGSVPTSVWVSKSFFNIDIRDYGSGNAGATIPIVYWVPNGAHL